ncbi:small highly charged protein [Shewanella avicenniae]|uniref:Small highly charged protein n=1 Tax=Shewanella avicenniae TaxID=2814294 RepID=A0ABX7QN49_9GAMM|nr:small highly charged protein [Shewanella avicenniae]QSX32879.1 small highly charged protein [Shewanella avicenniae]
MSREYYFDEEDSSWDDEQLRGKPRSKKVKQRRRDTKRRYFDEHMETEYLDTKWQD